MNNLDLHEVAQLFDEQEVLDGYSGVLLFTGQLDVYDLAKKDTATGWRRTISAASVTLPARGVVTIDSDRFLVGRTIKDSFLGSAIRTHLVLQPCDGLFEVTTAANFLAGTAGTTFYGALSLLKEQKEESVSSQFFNLFEIYQAATETGSRDKLVKAPDGIYYRIQNVQKQTGGLKTLVASELDSGALTTATYTTAQTYNSTTDTVGESVVGTFSVFSERYQGNYRYSARADNRYEPGDLVVTFSAVNVASPKAGDIVTKASVRYQVLDYQSDTLGSWELHVRPL